MGSPQLLSVVKQFGSISTNEAGFTRCFSYIIVA